MAKEPPTVSELRKAAKVSDDEINAAVGAVLASPDMRLWDWAPRFTSDAFNLPRRGRMWLRNFGEYEC